MAQKNIRRDQISPQNSILYGAAAGYAVRGIQHGPDSTMY